MLRCPMLRPIIGRCWCSSARLVPGLPDDEACGIAWLARRGALQNVSFAAVDADAEAEVARQLMRGSSIPQLIAFSQSTDGKWHREQITGATSEQDVQSLIARGVQAQQPAAASGAIGN